MAGTLLDQLARGLVEQRIAPYLGPALLHAAEANAWFPTRAETIAERLSKRAAVPARLRRNLSASAQYIENFRHRRVLRGIVHEIFSEKAEATALHHLLAALPVPLVVDVGYDCVMAQALATHREPGEWGEIQALSRADHRAKADVELWTRAYDAAGTPVDPAIADGWQTVLYKPLGSVAPEANFLISDADFVEVLTEIDIQTPIPEAVKSRRTGLGFLFVGCRFDDQLSRTYARQIIKRSPGPHYAVVDEGFTRNAERFLAEQGIAPIEMPLTAFVEGLRGAVAAVVAVRSGVEAAMAV